LFSQPKKVYYFTAQKFISLFIVYVGRNIYMFLRNNFLSALFSFVCVFLFFSNSASVKGQLGLEEKRLTWSSATNSSRPSAATRPTVRRQTESRGIQIRTREIRTTDVRLVKTTNLTVKSEPGAQITLLHSATGKEMSRQVPTGGLLILENVAPGKYIVSGSLDSYSSEKIEVTVPAQKTIGIELDLEALTYRLKIETNIREGEVRYAPARQTGVNADGSIRTAETAGYCIVRIKDGKAEIKDLNEGFYNLDIRPQEAEFEPVLTAVNVPDDITDDDETGSGSLKSVSINLEKKESTDQFFSASASDWSVPQSWKIENGVIKNIGTTGIALPLNEKYLHYINFELVAQVKLVDSNTIGLILRARNAQNYYLVEISGARAQEPYVVTGYVVKDGKRERLRTIPIAHFAPQIDNAKSFRLYVRAENNSFRLFIDDGNENPLPVGNIDIRDNVFPKGAVGIAGIRDSNFEVGTFLICYKSCR